MQSPTSMSTGRNAHGRFYLTELPTVVRHSSICMGSPWETMVGIDMSVDKVPRAVSWTKKVLHTQLN